MSELIRPLREALTCAGCQDRSTAVEAGSQSRCRTGGGVAEGVRDERIAVFDKHLELA